MKIIASRIQLFHLYITKAEIRILFPECFDNATLARGIMRNLGKVTFRNTFRKPIERFYITHSTYIQNNPITVCVKESMYALVNGKGKRFLNVFIIKYSQCDQEKNVSGYFGKYGTNMVSKIISKFVSYRCTGFNFENNRADRDQYITINFDNVVTGTSPTGLLAFPKKFFLINYYAKHKI